MPLFAIVVSDTVPLAATALVVVNVLSVVTEKLLNVSPPEVRLSGPAAEFTTVALLVVFKVKLGVDVWMLPILPDPEESEAEVVPVKVPELCEIAPDPLALRVSTVPLALAPNAMPPLFAVVDRPSVPVAVIDPDVVSAALLETATLLPVDEPAPIFNAVPDVAAHVTLPVVLKVRLLIVALRVDIAPDPEVKFKLVAEIEPLV